MQFEISSSKKKYCTIIENLKFQISLVNKIIKLLHSTKTNENIMEKLIKFMIKLSRGDMMKKILILSLFIFCYIVTGCTKEDRQFQHYDLKDKALNTYIYYSDERGKEVYALADITPSNYESCLTGLFYKVAENDYILLETLEFNQKDAYKKDNVYQFYENKLYGIGNGNSPMVFEIELSGEESKMQEINYQIDGKINPFLVTSIKEINHDEISYYGYATVEGNNNFSSIKCSTSTYECVITSDN